ASRAAARARTDCARPPVRDRPRRGTAGQRGRAYSEQPDLATQRASGLWQSALIVECGIRRVVERERDLASREQPGPAQIEAARELGIDTCPCIQLLVATNIRVHAVLPARMPKLDGTLDPLEQRSTDVQPCDEGGLVLRLVLILRRRRITQLDILERCVRCDLQGTDRKQGKQLDAVAAHLVAVHPLEVSIRRADANHGVAQTVREPDGLYLSRPHAQRRAQLADDEPLRFQVRIRLEATERAGVQLPQRREARAPARGSMEKQCTIGRDRGGAYTRTPGTQRFLLGAASGFRRIGTVEHTAQGEPRIPQPTEVTPTDRALERRTPQPLPVPYDGLVIDPLVVGDLCPREGAAQVAALAETVISQQAQRDRAVVATLAAIQLVVCERAVAVDVRVAEVEPDRRLQVTRTAADCVADPGAAGYARDDARDVR